MARPFLTALDGMGVILQTPDDVERFWKAWGLERGFATREPNRIYRETQATRRTVRPHVSAGQWLFDCPCGAADFCIPDHPYAYCRGCGTRHNIRWPPAEERLQAEHLLAPRPRIQQTWFFDRGEPVEQLARENVEHGVG